MLIEWCVVWIRWMCVVSVFLLLVSRVIICCGWLVVELVSVRLVVCSIVDGVV